MLTKPLTRNTITDIARDYIDEIVRFIRKTDPEFSLGYTKLDWGANRSRSWGGAYKVNGEWVPGISICMLKFYRPETCSSDLMEYPEYATIRNDLVIGGFLTSDWKVALRAILCHEIAHSWAWYKYPFDAKKHKGHKEPWRSLYKSLRLEFVNSFVDSTLEKSKAIEIDDPKEKALFRQHCTKHGLEEEWFGATFRFFDGDTYTINGWNPRARKYHVRAVNNQKNKQYVLKPHEVKHYILSQAGDL